jgi:hypothetical protein
MLRTARLAIAARELRATILLAGPLIGGQLCLIAGNVVDVVLAGHSARVFSGRSRSAPAFGPSRSSRFPA